MPDLTGTSTPIPIAAGGYQLRAPGLVGTVKEIDARASATRGDGGLRDAQLLSAIDGGRAGGGQGVRD